MNTALFIICNISILIAAVIGIVRFPSIMKAYRPFIYLVWAGCINSFLTLLSPIYSQQPFSRNLLYDICQAVMLIWFYRNTGAFQKTKVIFYGLIIFFIILFIGESFWGKNLGNDFLAYSALFYSSCIVLLSINCINSLIFKEREIVKNASFLVSIGALIFFTYKGLTELFWLYGLNFSEGFTAEVSIILIYINLLCSLIYILAILRMRRQLPVSLHY